MAKAAAMHEETLHCRTPTVADVHSASSVASTGTTPDLPHPETIRASAQLPTEIILLILIHLDHHTLLAATSTCRRWNALINRHCQYLWRHLAWRDFSFTASRGLWKLEFIKDRDLRLCFPLSAGTTEMKSNEHGSYVGNSVRLKNESQPCAFCQRLKLVQAESSSILGELGELGPEVVSTSGTLALGIASRTYATKAEMADQPSLCSCESFECRKGMQRADGIRVDGLQYTVCPDKEDEEEDWRRGQQDQDWRALYQLTSNWYRGRAKGYCPLMLPSLTTLASATRTLSESSHSATASRSGPTNTTLSAISTPAQRAIERILRRRRPLAIVGLQHEGSALTALSLASFPTQNFDARGDCGSESSGERTRQVAVIRSNPHYREKRPAGSQTQHSHPQQYHPFSSVNNAHSLSSGSSIQTNQQAPNIMAQDPLQHDRVVFAIRPNPTLLASTADASIDQDLSVDLTEADSSLHPQPQIPQGQLGPLLLSLPLGHPIIENPADDILCHYSSPLHSFLVTGHMDGSVRLWDMSIQLPAQQCIRHWQTGARRRVLCVGMNSRVVVCGNADSTLCVWDIHPDPSSSLSSHGTIHSASYLASTAPPGLDDWVSGIEHICVGDSLVACSTEFSGSVLVFSLATGSLVYEIPGLYQPSKMCMTDFFLLTGGRGAWNQGGRMRQPNQRQNGHQQHQQQQMGGHANYHTGAGLDGNVADQRNRVDATTMEVDEYMSCCINVWDLRTGDRLYSLIPRLPTQNLQQARNFSSIFNNPPAEDIRHGRKAMASRNGKRIRTTTRSPDMSMVRQSGVSSSVEPWGDRLGSTSRSAIAIPSLGVGADEGSRVGSSMTSGEDVGSSRQQLGADSTSHLQSPTSPESPISAPLTLLDISVSPDNSTLVATLCERSGEGREGVYCWDFGGSRLEGYHEDGTELSTLILDRNDIEYSRERADPEGGEFSNELQSDSEKDEDQTLGGGFYSNDKINNNMVMQQVDSAVFRDLHQARITGKVWVGWKLGEREFLRRKADHEKRMRFKRERRAENWRRHSTVDCGSDVVESMKQISL